MRDKKPFESKKFIALSVGVIMTVMFFIGSMITMVLRPEIANSIVSLTTVGIGSINAAISLYAVGQSAVDFRIANVSSTSSHETRKTEFKKFEMKYD